MTEQPGAVARAALALTDWTERWVPDAFIFALMATILAIASALHPAILGLVAHGGLVGGGLIPFRHTIFLWQSFPAVAVEIAVVVGVMYLATPPLGRGKTARDLGIDLRLAELRTENSELRIP